jgi:hypothetical protein
MSRASARWYSDLAAGCQEGMKGYDTRVSGVSEGIRTLDPNLGKIRVDEISTLNQMKFPL